MQTFFTEFPVDGKHSSADFFVAVKEWILSSPNTALTEQHLQKMTHNVEDLMQINTEQVESLCLRQTTEDMAAVRYTKTDIHVEWSTSVVFSKQGNLAWVSVKIEWTALTPARKTLLAKKPSLIKMLLKHLGYGSDGEIKLTDLPLELGLDQVAFAKRCHQGKARVRLPMVYVNTYKHWVDSERLAHDLVGMAHVVLQANPTLTQQMHNHDDAPVHLHWPDGDGHVSRSFFIGHGGYDSHEELERAVIKEIQSTLSTRRPYLSGDWGSVQQALSKQKYVELAEQNTKNLEEFTETFDSETQEKDSRIASDAKEILRLQSELKKYQHLQMGENGSLPNVSLKRGKELDLYDNELHGLVVDALKAAHKNSASGSRRHALLTELIAANPSTGEAERLRDLVRKMLKDYRNMDSKTEKTLKEIGFSMTESGKHYKIVFKNDGRYTHSMPKSGSDTHGGMNLASEIIGRIF